MRNALWDWGEQAYFEEHNDLVALRPAKGRGPTLPAPTGSLQFIGWRWPSSLPLLPSLNIEYADRAATEAPCEPHRQPCGTGYTNLPETRISKAVWARSAFSWRAFSSSGQSYPCTSSPDPAARLGLLTMWTVVFAFSVSVLSTARRSELFAATAA